MVSAFVETFGSTVTLFITPNVLYETKPQVSTTVMGSEISPVGVMSRMHVKGERVAKPLY